MGRNKKASWLVKIQCPTQRRPMWFGSFQADGRQDAKRAARLFVSEHFHYEIQILAIAQGRIALELHGDEIQIEDEP